MTRLFRWRMVLSVQWRAVWGAFGLPVPLSRSCKPLTACHPIASGDRDSTADIGFTMHTHHQGATAHTRIIAYRPIWRA